MHLGVHSIVAPAAINLSRYHPKAVHGKGRKLLPLVCMSTTRDRVHEHRRGAQKMGLHMLASRLHVLRKHGRLGLVSCKQ